MVRKFPLAPLERIAKKSGAERVSLNAVKEIRSAILEMAETIASDAVVMTEHAGRVTVKAKDIRLACR